MIRHGQITDAARVTKGMTALTAEQKTSIAANPDPHRRLTRRLVPGKADPMAQDPFDGRPSAAHRLRSAADLEANRFFFADALPLRPVADIQAQFNSGGLGLAESAVYRTFDAESPIGARPGMSETIVKLPPVSQKVTVRSTTGCANVSPDVDQRRPRRRRSTDPQRRRPHRTCPP